MLLKYPELIDDYDPSLLPAQPYVAVHLGASTPNKIPPNPSVLTRGLLLAGVHFVLVGNEARDLPPILRLHIDVVKRARKFIGTLSVFNCVAQIKKIPSLVLVNRAVKDPSIYALMHANNAKIIEWNNGSYSHAQIYHYAVEWAQQ
jgi:hypothetical protein